MTQPIVVSWDTTNCCVVGFCVGMHYIRNTLANSAQVMLKSTYCQCLIWTTADQEMRYTDYYIHT